MLLSLVFLLLFSPVAVMMMMMMIVMIMMTITMLDAFLIMVRRIDNSQGRFQQHSEHVYYVVLTPLLIPAELINEPTIIR